MPNAATYGCMFWAAATPKAVWALVFCHGRCERRSSHSRGPSVSSCLCHGNRTIGLSLTAMHPHSSTQQRRHTQRDEDRHSKPRNSATQSRTLQCVHTIAYVRRVSVPWSCVAWVWAARWASTLSSRDAPVRYDTDMSATRAPPTPTWPPQASVRVVTPRCEVLSLRKKVVMRICVV